MHYNYSNLDMIVFKGLLTEIMDNLPEIVMLLAFIEKYPLSMQDIVKIIKTALPLIKKTDIDVIIKLIEDEKIKRGLSSLS